MARIPCSFSAQEDFLTCIDARAQQLGMKRSEYIVHALRMELDRGGSMVIHANQSGVGNKQSIFKSASARARKPAEKPRGKRGKAKAEGK